ncbi:MAG: hypothetical protein AAF581_19740 [Planctomycetota bacterium]
MLQPDVVELLRQFERLEIFTDNKLEGEYKKVQKEITGYNAQPTFIILDSKHQREVARSSFTNSAEAFKDFLRKGLTDQPVFQSRLKFSKLVPLDGQMSHPIEIDEAGTLTASAGTKTMYLGEEAMAYTGAFEAAQDIQLPGELEPGKYALDATLETSVYVGEEWHAAYKLRTRMPITIE